MTEPGWALTFGPVPSRRLGHSLGVNNIPPKACTYACVYCQLGRTPRMLAEPRSFYEPDELFGAVQTRLASARAREQVVDYVTFVPDGEPTLDANLGREIDLLKPLGLPIAVITNASLLGSPEVRETLARADWVSLKLDAVDEAIWHRVDRPHGSLRLDRILAGMETFADAYDGTLVTETMLVAGINDCQRPLRALAERLQALDPTTAYLAVPIRPPAEAYVRPPSEEQLLNAYALLSRRLEKVELLVGYEGNAFASSGDVEADLLSITAVHPMRDDAVAALLRKAGASWDRLVPLLESGSLIESQHSGHRFYVRRLIDGSTSPSTHR